MLFRFPPVSPDINDSTFLSTDSKIFAKLKIESKAGKRTVFMTEHTLIFVISGIKLLHFSDHTLKITPNSVFLLKKGIYVMAEYIEEGLEFEALMIFLPENILKSFIPKPNLNANYTKNQTCVVFPANQLIQDFKAQFRQYFNHRLFDYKLLIPLKQHEILTLLLSSGFKQEMLSFIYSAVCTDLKDMTVVIEENILQPITVSELARLCNRSLAAFKRDFKKQYHSSPRIYINQHRLNHAKMLLENTAKQISEISTDCAFESTSYFIRIFKQQFGVTPQRMRAKITIE